MDNNKVKELLGDTPFMSLEQANNLTSFMVTHSLFDVLELGFAHGVSTCYIAAALARQGKGSIVAIDNESARNRIPDIDHLLTLIGERKRVTIFYEPTSYTWRLMKFLEEDPRLQFDMCYLDGAHNWYVDGFSFYLINLLLKPGGWIIFDDMDWTYAKSPALAETDFVRQMPDEEKTTPQVRKIYELLVRPHPEYHNFLVKNGWAYAQKYLSSEKKTHHKKLVTEKIIEIQKEKEHFGIGWFLYMLIMKIRGK